MMRFHGLERVALVFASLWVLAAAPYDDSPQHRFTLTLPEGWQLSPRFGDLNGMVFQRSTTVRGRTSVATLIVHVDSVEAKDLDEFADVLEEGLRQQPGFSRTSQDRATIAGQPALVREYRALVSKKPKVEKKMRAYYFEAEGRRFRVHFETLAQDFGSMSKGLPAILQSFKPGTRRAEREALALQRAAAEGLTSSVDLSGRWVNGDGLVMVLGGDGSFALAESMGRWEVKGGVLTMIVPGQGQESFSFVLDEAVGTLTLSSPNLGEPMVYRRAQGPAGETPASVSDDKQTRPLLVPGASASDVVGRWSTPTANGFLILDLRRDHAFSMGPTTGTWVQEGDRLTLTRRSGENVTYTARRSGESLLLSGGDLEGEVVFSR